MNMQKYSALNQMAGRFIASKSSEPIPEQLANLQLSMGFEVGEPITKDNAHMIINGYRHQLPSSIPGNKRRINDYSEFIFPDEVEPPQSGQGVAINGDIPMNQRNGVTGQSVATNGVIPMDQRNGVTDQSLATNGVIPMDQRNGVTTPQSQRRPASAPRKDKFNPMLKPYAQRRSPRLSGSGQRVASNGVTPMDQRNGVTTPQAQRTPASAPRMERVNPMLKPYAQRRSPRLSGSGQRVATNGVTPMDQRNGVTTPQAQRTPASAPRMERVNPMLKPYAQRRSPRLSGSVSTSLEETSRVNPMLKPYAQRRSPRLSGSGSVNLMLKPYAQKNFLPSSSSSDSDNQGERRNGMAPRTVLGNHNSMVKRNAKDGDVTSVEIGVKVSTVTNGYRSSVLTKTINFSFTNEDVFRRNNRKNHLRHFRKKSLPCSFY